MLLKGFSSRTLAGKNKILGELLTKMILERLSKLSVDEVGKILSNAEQSVSLLREERVREISPFLAAVNLDPSVSGEETGEKIGDDSSGIKATWKGFKDNFADPAIANYLARNLVCPERSSEYAEHFEIKVRNDLSEPLFFSSYLSQKGMSLSNDPQMYIRAKDKSERIAKLICVILVTLVVSLFMLILIVPPIVASNGHAIQGIITSKFQSIDQILSMELGNGGFSAMIGNTSRFDIQKYQVWILNSITCLLMPIFCFQFYRFVKRKVKEARLRRLYSGLVLIAWIVGGLLANFFLFNFGNGNLLYDAFISIIIACIPMVAALIFNFLFNFRSQCVSVAVFVFSLAGLIKDLLRYLIYLPVQQLIQLVLVSWYATEDLRGFRDKIKSMIVKLGG